MKTALHRPQLETRNGFTVVGLPRDGSPETDEDALWDRFGDRYDEFAAVAAADEAFGITHDQDDDATSEYAYLAGVELDPFTPASVPADAVRVDVPAGQYAVFETTLQSLDETKTFIHDEWLPDSEYERGTGPSFEHYEAGFDHSTNPWFTVWVPIQD